MLLEGDEEHPLGHGTQTALQRHGRAQRARPSPRSTQRHFRIVLQERLALPRHVEGVRSPALGGRPARGPAGLARSRGAFARTGRRRPVRRFARAAHGGLGIRFSMTRSPCATRLLRNDGQSRSCALRRIRRVFGRRCSRLELREHEALQVWGMAADRKSSMGLLVMSVAREITAPLVVTAANAAIEPDEAPCTRSSGGTSPGARNRASQNPKSILCRTGPHRRAPTIRG